MQTNYGEEYNRESMYETAREYLLEGKEVKVNGKKCKSLIQVMMQDHGLEVKKVRKLAKQEDRAFKNGNQEEFGIKYRQSMDRLNGVTALDARLKSDFDDLTRIQAENNALTDKIQSIRNLNKCTLQQLDELVNALEQYRYNLVYCMDGDLVNTELQKAFDITTKYIDEVEEEIQNRQAHSL